MMKSPIFLKFCFLIAFAFSLSNALIFGDGNINVAAKPICNSDGYVLNLSPSYAFENVEGQRLQTKLYLGKSCDAYSEGRGKGAWCWTNAGILTEFDGVTVPLAGIELPICSQHSNDSPCGCWDAPLPSNPNSNSGQSGTFLETTPAPQITENAVELESEQRQRKQTIEKYLKILGFDPGLVDGVTDQATLDAYNAFQRANGLEIVHHFPNTHFEILERKTEETLMAMTAPPPNYDPNTRTAQPNSSSTVIAAPNPFKATAHKSVSNTSPNQKPQITRTEKNGLVHYQIDTCEFEEGLGTTLYYFHEAPPKVELTDLCFDRDGGSLLAAEPVSNLTLVEELGSTDRFEIIEADTEYYNRAGVSAGKYRFLQPEEQWAAEADWGNFMHDPKSMDTGKRNPGAYGYSTRGFIFGERTPYSEITLGEYNISLSVSDIYDHLNRIKFNDREGETPIIVVHSLENISGNSNEIEFDSRTDYVVGKVKLNLVIAEDGQIGGSGSIMMENPRIAGINPHDWKSSELRISNIVGYFVGSRGLQFKGIGFVTGRTVDQDGFVHESFGTVNLSGQTWLDESPGDQAQMPKDKKFVEKTDTNLQIEEMLTQLGFDPGPADGALDEKTISAIHAFQKQFGLPHGDVLTPEQLIVLEAVVKARAN